MTGKFSADYDSAFKKTKISPVFKITVLKSEITIFEHHVWLILDPHLIADIIWEENYFVQRTVEISLHIDAAHSKYESQIQMDPTPEI